MRKDIQTVFLGKFSVISNQILINDPCYDKSNGSLVDVKNGDWLVSMVIDLQDQRCAALWIHHKDHKIQRSAPIWLDNGLGTGVDSGQAGFFEPFYYNNAQVVTEKIKDPLTGKPWYDLCCDRTLSEQGAGIIPYGSVASSGWGDGFYAAYSVEKDQETVALALDFGLVKGLFPPLLTEIETDFYYSIVDNEPNRFQELILTEPQLLDEAIFLNIAIYAKRYDFLERLLKLRLSTEGIDWEHIMYDGKLELLRIVSPYVNPPEQERNVLESLYWWDVTEEAIEALNLLIQAGFPPNPKPNYHGQTPIIFKFQGIHDLSDPKIKLLEYWIKLGLKVYALDSKGNTIIDHPKTSDVFSEYIQASYSLPDESGQVADHLGKTVEIIEGPFKGFMGKVVQYKEEKFEIELKIFGRATLALFSPQQLDLD